MGSEKSKEFQKENSGSENKTISENGKMRRVLKKVLKWILKVKRVSVLVKSKFDRSAEFSGSLFYLFRFSSHENTHPVIHAQNPLTPLSPSGRGGGLSNGVFFVAV